MRSPIDVLIYVEHPSRELDLASLYCHLLESKHGLEARMAPVFFRDYEVFASFDPKVVVLPNYYAPSKGSEKTRAFFPHAQFLNLSSEQIFSRLNYDRKAPKGDFALKDLMFLAWSEGYRDYLISKAVEPSNITVTGNPTYSLYLFPWSRLYDRRLELAKKHGLDPRKRWVFFPENYGAAWFSREKMAKMIDDGADREGVEANHQTALESLREVCAWLNSVPSGVELILRPRPSTGKDKFLDLAGQWLKTDTPGLTITDEGTVREWILASDSVASSYSTSLIEAAVAGKDICMALPLPLPPSLYHEFYDLVPSAKTEEEWQAFIKGEAEGSPLPLAEWAKEAFMPLGDPVPQVVDWIAASVRSHDGWRPTPEFGRKARLKDLLFKAKSALRGRGEKRLASDDLSQDQASAAVRGWRNLDLSL